MSAFLHVVLRVLFIYVCISLSLPPCVTVSLCLPVYLSASVSLCLPVCLPVSVCVCVFIVLFVVLCFFAYLQIEVDLMSFYFSSFSKRRILLGSFRDSYNSCVFRLFTGSLEFKVRGTSLWEGLSHWAARTESRVYGDCVLVHGDTVLRS